MSRMTPTQLRTVAQVSLGVIEAVEIAGEQGARAVVLYAAMQAQGATFNQFMSLMTTLVRPGYLTMEDNYYRATSTTHELKTKLTNTLAALAS